MLSRQSGELILACPDDPQIKCDSNKGCINISTGNPVEVCDPDDPDCSRTISADTTNLCGKVLGGKWEGCENSTHYKCSYEYLPVEGATVNFFSVSDPKQNSTIVSCSSGYSCNSGTYECEISTEVTRDPNSTRVVIGGWRNPSGALSDDSSRANCSVNRCTQEYGKYGFNTVIPPEATIQKVEVGVKGYTTDTDNQTLEIQVTWDNWNSKKAVNITSYPSETMQWVDITSFVSWDPNKLSDSNFKVRMKLYSTAGTYYVNWIPVRVQYYHSYNACPAPYKKAVCNDSDSVICTTFIANGTTDRNGLFSFTLDIDQTDNGGSRVYVGGIQKSGECPEGYVENGSECLWFWETWGKETSWPICDYDKDKLLGDDATIYVPAGTCCKWGEVNLFGWHFCIAPGSKYLKCKKTCGSGEKCIRYFGCKEYPNPACHPGDQIEDFGRAWYMDFGNPNSCWNTFLPGWNSGDVCYYGATKSRCGWFWSWDRTIYPCAEKTTLVKMIVPDNEEEARRGDMPICLTWGGWRNPTVKKFCDCTTAGRCGTEGVCRGYDEWGRSTCANNLRCGAEIYRCDVPWWCGESIETGGGGWLVDRCSEFSTSGAYMLIYRCNGGGVKFLNIPMYQYSWRVADCWYWSDTCFGGCGGRSLLAEFLNGCDSLHKIGAHCVCKDCANYCYGYQNAANHVEGTIYEKNRTFQFNPNPFSYILFLTGGWPLWLIPLPSYTCSDGEDVKFKNMIESGCFYGEACGNPYSIPKFSRTIRDPSGRVVCICDSTKKTSPYPKDCGNNGNGNGVCVNENLGIVARNTVCTATGWVSNFTDATITEVFIVNEIGAYCGYKNCVKTSRDSLACTFFQNPSLGCPTFDERADIFSLVVKVKNTGTNNITKGFLLFGDESFDPAKFTNYPSSLIHPDWITENEWIFDIIKLRRSVLWKHVFGFALTTDNHLLKR
ncbi:MAG: hypothetical protein DRO09_03440, partial [Thermoprotei archaeon]